MKNPYRDFINEGTGKKILTLEHLKGKHQADESTVCLMAAALGFSHRSATQARMGRGVPEAERRAVWLWGSILGYHLASVPPGNPRKDRWQSALFSHSLHYNLGDELSTMIRAGKNV